MARAQTAIVISPGFYVCVFRHILLSVLLLGPSLLQSVGSLRRDLNFAQSVMKAEYESKLMQRAIEL